ncbi:MAG: 3-dehydroquinate synthase, partial [Alphaproteobacteria bacterium]|nr:3-dehydroquinate synthase [Alphaproteobacteria bacterium]
FGEALRHGEAVAIGMVLAARLSAALGLMPAAEADRIARHLASVGLPTRPAEIPGLKTNAADLLALMGQDKKVKDGAPAFVLLRCIGHAVRDVKVEATKVLAVLEAGLAG